MNLAVLKDLEKLSLSTNEAKVYCTLFELGQTSAGAVIKKTQLHRAVAYETLDRLVDRKLVFKVNKKNITYYQPTSPERLLEDAKEKQKIAEKLVPQFKKLLQSNLPEITIYEGAESYQRFWIDAYLKMPVGTIDYVAGSVGGKQWVGYLGEKIAEEIEEIRKRRKIKWKMIVFEKNDPVQDQWLRDNSKLNEYRLIKRAGKVYGNFNIFGNRSLVLHSPTEPLIIEIKNETLIKVFQNIFDILWLVGKKI